MCHGGTYNCKECSWELDGDEHAHDELVSRAIDHYTETGHPVERLDD